MLYVLIGIAVLLLVFVVCCCCACKKNKISENKILDETPGGTASKPGSTMGIKNDVEDCDLSDVTNRDDHEKNIEFGVQEHFEGEPTDRSTVKLKVSN